MEHIFLGSRDHFGIEYALRRAELLGLGADQPLTDAVVATRSALDLDDGEFWRTVWLFLIANSGSIDLAQVGPIIDFVHAVRHERVAIDTADGIVIREPPQPQFSFEGPKGPLCAEADGRVASRAWLGDGRAAVGVLAAASHGR